MSDTAQVRITKVFDPDEGHKPYAILTEDGKRFTTFEAALGEKAKEFQGKAGNLQFLVTTKTKGDKTYTNYVYEGFAPSDSIKTLDDEVMAAINGTAPNYRQLVHPQEQASIQRAVALQRANEWLPYMTGENEPDIESVFKIAERYRQWLAGE